MTLKKMLLIAGMALTAVAFAAPAMAHADEWYTDVEVEEGVLGEETLGTTTATGDTVEFTGALTWTKSPLRQSCVNAHVKAILWNAGGTATGEVESIVYTVPCTVAVNTAEGYKDVAGCEITAMESKEFPWHINVATGTNGIDIEGANFSNTYSGCGALGIPNGAKLGFIGTATGTWTNASGGCILFNNSGDLKNPAGEGITLDDGVCNSGMNGLTLK